MDDRTTIEVDDLKPCVVCGKPTQYIDYCAEVRLCSKECDAEFFEELNKHFCEMDGEPEWLST